MKLASVVVTPAGCNQGIWVDSPNFIINGEKVEMGFLPIGIKIEDTLICKLHRSGDTVTITLDLEE